jgi:hypothetical protein
LDRYYWYSTCWYERILSPHVPLSQSCRRKVIIKPAVLLLDGQYCFWYDLLYFLLFRSQTVKFFLSKSRPNNPRGTVLDRYYWYSSCWYQRILSPHVSLSQSCRRNVIIKRAVLLLDVQYCFWYDLLYFLLFRSQIVKSKFLS